MQEGGEGFRKGGSETAALGAGAREQTREVGGGRGAACSHVRPTWDTPVTVSALHCRASGQHVPGFRLWDRHPSVNPSSRAARGLWSAAGHRGARAVPCVAAEANQRRAGGRLTAMPPTKQEGRTLLDTGSGSWRRACKSSATQTSLVFCFPFSVKTLAALAAF